MSLDDQRIGMVDSLRGLGLTCRAAPTEEENVRGPEPKVVRGLFKRAKTPARDLSGATPLQKAMARDLLGFDTLPPSAITYHTMLSSLDTDGGLNLVDCTWPAGTHIPRHVHHCEDELLIVLSGTVELRIVERIVRCGAGETAFIPLGTEHEVRALSEARHICILTRRAFGAHGRREPE